MIAVDGEAAKVLAGIVRKRWKEATGKDIPPAGSTGDPWPETLEVAVTDIDVGIACTMPERDGKPAVREIERLYLDMIARARRYISSENQYFTSERIGEALARRLAEPDGPEIVVVSRLLSLFRLPDSQRSPA
jgi:phosphatidylserine/phosphatidylglycerophosphate/cardiolipin synthase-like enzyme